MKRSISNKRKRQQSVEITSKKRRRHQSHSKSRRISTRQHFLSLTQFNEITHPNWESICPNIDQILSNKHSQSGVYAHEIQLVQQELEALLSMAIVRENFLQSKTDANLHSTIYQHKQAENTYAQEKSPTKPLPPLVPLTNQRHHGPQMLLDRQVSISPIVGTRIDKLWTDLDTFYHKISPNHILSIENLFTFHENFEDKLRHYKTNYQNHNLTDLNIRKQLNEEDFHEFLSFSQTNSLLSHYFHNTTLNRVQTQFSSRLSHLLSPSSSSSSRLSRRLNPIQLDERLEFVREYLADQHPIITKRISQRKKQHRQSLNTPPIADEFESKLSTLITLAHECSILNECALKRARLQSTNEQILLKFDAIQHDLENLIGKIDSSGDEKLLHKLDNLLKDWTNYENQLRLPPMEFD